jgi:hypothetical protein
MRRSGRFSRLQEESMISRMRILVTIAVASCWAIAGCGDNSNTSRDVTTVTPGFFIGETHNGEDLSIAVGSIREIFFRCSGLIVSERFDPPEPVAGDGSFAVEVHSGPGTFIVSGQIVSNDRIEGAIAGTAACDGSFVARRCNPSTQACGDRDGDLIPDEVDPDASTSPTPARTPTAVATSGATASAPTPSATASPTAVCGNGILEGDEECDKHAIDDSSCFEDVCTCEDFCDDAGGTLSCNSDCTLNFSHCTAGGCSF